ncbi:MAG: DoxX family membrane protein [Cyanobium sp. MED843]|nr:DoxX family membrane protein [Cyanobium sp. MED843]OUW29758.1 MAG: hypothetical protein CBD37_02705 [Cyanobacteria bacterium TMED177]
MTTELFDRVGRIALAAMFIRAVPGKLLDFDGTVASIASKGIAVPFASALLAAAITLLIVGSSLLIAGRDTRIGAALLLVFLLPTTLIFHGSVQDPGLVRNVTLMGALLLAITRPEALCSHRPLSRRARRFTRWWT